MDEEKKSALVPAGAEAGKLPGRVERKSIAEIVAQINFVKKLLDLTMKDGIHYGKVPGVKTKFLFKAGADKIKQAFNLSPHFERDDQPILYPGGHIGFNIKCVLSPIGFPDIPIAEGVGSASTLEPKYRYVHGESESTGKPVPREYWKLREKEEWKEAKKLIGGDKFIAWKNPRPTLGRSPRSANLSSGRTRRKSIIPF